MKKFLIFIVLAVLLSASNLLADCPPECTTCVSGTIVNETWTVNGSPYCVEGDILVAGLTIEPSVRVEFLGNYVFEVAGVLTAIGTEQDPIIFTREESNAVGWQGIFFNYSSPGSEIAYCTVEESISSGIRIDSSEPIIRKCTITNNSGAQGGGIYVIGTATFTLDSCTVTNNSTSGNSQLGGGIYVDSGETILTNCEISNNSISSAYNSYGGGIYANGPFTMINSTISGNSIDLSTCSRSLTSSGGGIYINGTASISNSIIYYNSASARVSWCGVKFNATSRGGGAYIHGTFDLTNTIISNNTAHAGAAAGSTIRIGGGLYSSAPDTSSKIINSTVAYNTNEGFNNNAVESVIIINSIFYFNTVAQISGNATVTYSDVQGGYDGDGNINFNPIFNGCLQILPGSMCIDAGNPDLLYNDVCLPPSLGTERNDMGAHGGPGACQWVYCNGDFDKDCDIDGSDLSVFAADFGRTDCSGDCEGDFDSDNDVDGSDLAVFAANFGQTDCCPK